MIFLGFISLNKGASSSIRNNQIISELKRKGCKITEIDFYYPFQTKIKIIQIFSLIGLFIKSFFIILINFKRELTISTNPKFLVVIPCILRKRFTLYLGDPFVGDVSKNDSYFYTFLWKYSKNLIKELVVFSPFLYQRFKYEGTNAKLKFIQRSPIHNLPIMSGEGILYLGDFNSIDRNFEPVITVLNELNIKLDIFGVGNLEIISKKTNNIKLYARRSFSEIFNIIPNYKLMLIILNRSGLQVPGKLYDFADAPFKVLILYEDYLDITLLPQPANYIYCKNVASEIKIVVSKLLQKLYIATK